MIREDIDGSFLLGVHSWGGPLRRSTHHTHRNLQGLRVCPILKKNPDDSPAHPFLSIVEFASPEDAQRAVRELSEVPLLGRPVFIREVSGRLGDGDGQAHRWRRIAKMNHGLVLLPYLARSVWRWQGKASTHNRLHVLHITTISVHNKTLETNFTLAMSVPTLSICVCLLTHQLAALPSRLARPKRSLPRCWKHHSR
jgi:hypothetical protein